MKRSRPSRSAVEHLIRVACDDLINAGLLSVGWPDFDDDSAGVIDLCVETAEGISLDTAGRLLTRVVGHVVAPCGQTADYVAAHGSVVPDGAWIFRAGRSNFPERDQPPPQAARALDALLSAMTTPEEQRAAEDRWRARVVSDAGGDTSRLTLVAQVHAPWIGLGEDGRLDIVEDATGRRWLLLHDWSELSVVDSGMLDTLSERLAGQMAELGELKRLLSGAR